MATKAIRKGGSVTEVLDEYTPLTRLIGATADCARPSCQRGEPNNAHPSQRDRRLACHSDRDANLHCHRQTHLYSHNHSYHHPNHDGYT